MGFLSKLFGKKQEMKQEPVTFQKQEDFEKEDVVEEETLEEDMEEDTEEGVNYAEENERRLQAGGVSPEHFYRIFKENFPEYQIERNVSARRLDPSCHEKCRSIDFLFSQDNEPILAVVLTTQNQYRSMPFRGLEAVCDENDVLYMRFFIEMRNEPDYVRDRVAEELEEE